MESSLSWLDPLEGRAEEGDLFDKRVIRGASE